MTMRKSIFLLALLCASAYAAEPAAPVPPPPAMEPVPDAAPGPAPAPGEESVEPQVTIIQHEKETVEEFRIHNQLYMIKITPKIGKPYYLVDTTGSGKLDARLNELDPKILIPAWVIYKW